METIYGKVQKLRKNEWKTMIQNSIRNSFASSGVAAMTSNSTRLWFAKQSAATILGHDRLASDTSTHPQG
jgi:hypothetical protein